MRDLQPFDLVPQQRQPWLAAALAVLVLGACGAKPTPQAAPEPVAAAADKTQPAEPVAQVAPAPAAAPGPEPMDLPAGQTLGDLLPPLPKPAPRLGFANGGAPEPSGRDCTESAPSGYSLVKRIEVAVPAAKPGGAETTLQGCILHSLDGERSDRVGNTGRKYLLVAVGDDNKPISFEVAALSRAVDKLPPERQKAGHDASGWASLIATGDDSQPFLAVTSGRFYDGALGEEVHFARAAWLLKKTGEAWGWQPLLEKRFVINDFEHLHALCEGRADASAADRAAGTVAAACPLAERQTAHDEQAVARLATRKKRLGGTAGGDAQNDADPQSIWLREAKAALAKGEAAKAIEVALKVDVVCGEATGEAHALVREALAASKRELQRAQPAQTTNDMCEPLSDKPAPKRPKGDAKDAKPAKPVAKPAAHK
jgi:hypothetical protein